MAAPGAVMDPSVVGHQPRIVEEEAAGTFTTDHHSMDGEASISRIRVDNTFQGITIIVTNRYVLVRERTAKDIIAGMSIHLAANVMVMVGEVAHVVSRLMIIVTTASVESIQRNDAATRCLIGMMCPNARDMAMTKDAVQDDTIATTRIIEMAAGNVMIATGAMRMAIWIDERIASTIVIVVTETVSDGTKENTEMTTKTGNESTRKVIDVVAVEAAVTKINNRRSKILGGMKKASWALRRSNQSR